MMEILQELISTLLIILGVIFVMIAALGILRLPDFYIRMSAITKAGTMGVGLIVVGIAVYFNTLLISAKAFVIISFMLLTAPVAAHIIARAAYRQGVPFWGRNLIDELGDIVRKRDQVATEMKSDPGSLEPKLEMLDYLLRLPPILGGNMKKAELLAHEISGLDRAAGTAALALVLERGGNLELAESKYLEAVENSGGDSGYLYRLGRFYRDAGKSDMAVSVFTNILEKDPDEYEALLETGKTVQESGHNLDKGEEALIRYLQLESGPDSKQRAEACLYLALILLKKGKKASAREYLKKALEYQPGYQDAEQYLARI